MVSEVRSVREYANRLQYDILKRARQEGTLSQKYLTKPLWLTHQQAVELGYDVPEGEDFLLEPAEPREGALYGGIPLPTIPSPATVKPVQQPPLPVIPTNVDTALRNLYPESFAGTETPEETVLAFQSLVAEDPDTFIQDLASRGRSADTEAILRGFGLEDRDINAVFLPDTFQEALPFLVKERNKDEMTSYLLQNPETLRRDLIAAGRNAETERLVKTLYEGITEAQLINYFSQTALTIEKEAEQARSGFLPAFTAGTGDLVANAGGVLKWLGAEGIGQKIVDVGQFMQVQLKPDELGDFSWKQLFNGEWWINRGVRMLPNLMMLAIPGIGGYSLGASIAGRVIVGSFAKSVLGTIAKQAIAGSVAATLSRPIESAMEAAGAYDTARNRGLSHEDAEVAANKVFVDNLKLAGLDAAQIGLAFAPEPARVFGQMAKSGLFRVANVAGKLAFTGLTEGGEEVYQEMLQLRAQGDTRALAEMIKDPAMQEVFALGAAAGIGMGGGADIITRIQERVANNLTPEQKANFDNDKANFQAQGMTEEAATQKALDNVADTDEGKAQVEKATEQVDKETTLRQIEPKTEADKVALDGLKKKLVEEGQVDAEAVGYEEKPEEPPRPSEIPTEKTPEVTNQLKELGWSDERIAELDQREADNIIRRQVTPEAAGEVGQVTIENPEGETIASAYTEAPNAEGGATGRVFSRIATDYAEPSFKQKIKQGWHKFQYKMVDDLDPIRRIVEEVKKGAAALSIQENPYLLARLLRGVTSKATTFLENGTFGKQFWTTDAKGNAIPNYTGESLQNILNEVKDPVLWRDFSTYLVDRRAVELSERGIETGIEVADAKASITELEAKYPQFADLAQRVYKYQDSLLVYANETGLISNDLLEKLRKYGNYVPFYRVFNELQSKGAFGKKMANIANPIKRIKGSEREIINPLESIVKNTYVLISAADRNMVGIQIANLVNRYPELSDVFERVKTPIARVARVSAQELGVDIEGMTRAEEEQMVDIFRPSFFVRGDEVTVLIDGKKNYYRVDPELRDSLLRLDRESLGLLAKWLGAPARWLRAGATLSPDFMFRNPARDQLTAFAFSNYGFMPGIDFIRGLASVLRKDEAYQLFRMSGAEHSMLVSMDRSYLQKTFKQIVGENGFTEYVKHPLELFRIISELGEKATRLGEFKKGIASGAIPLEAGYSARSVTLDFAQAGTTAHAINTFVAFFNANLRGWGKLLSSFKEHPIRTSAKVFAGVTLPSILLWAVNHNDERWKEIPQWQKDLFWIVFAGDKIYRIPKPFELGIIFGSIPERFLDWMVDKDPELMKDVAQTLIESGSPGIIPTAGLPIIEWMTNYSFFRGRPIVSESRKALPPELQYTEWTSEVSKKLGELLKLSPMQIDNLLYGWTGGLGRYATDILDGVLKGTGISPDIPEPSPTLADMPVVKAFVVRSPYGSSSEAVNDFYNFLEKYEAGEKYLKETLANNELDKFNKYKAAHPELFFFADFDSERYSEAIAKGETPKDVFYSSSARYLRRVASELSEIRKKEDLIYKATDITSQEKRRLIDEMEMLKTQVARKAVDLLSTKDPTLLQDIVAEEISKLGEQMDDTPVLSLEEPDIYDMAELNRKFKSIIEGATVEELEAVDGLDVRAIAWAEKESIKQETDTILNSQVKNIDFNLREGATFDDYYRSWAQGIIADSRLDQLSSRQLELLRGYYESDKSKAYLTGLSDEDRALLTQNPYEQRMISNPEENAQLAIWGQAKIYTKEAYDEFKRLIKELDIPDSAIPEQILPPENSIETYFKRQELVAGNKESSAEGKLLLLEDYLKAQEADVESYAEWAELDIPDKPVEYYKLQVDNAGLFQKLSEISADDALSDDEKKTARAEVRATKVGDETFAQIEDRVTAIGKGTRDDPVPDTTVSLYVEHGKVVDEYGGGSIQAKLNRYDNPELNSFLMNEDYWGESASQPLDEDNNYLDNYLVPRWRIETDENYKAKDAEYQAILGRNKSNANSPEALKFMADNEDYRINRHKIDAYNLHNPATGERLPKDMIDTFVAYKELERKGFRQERFLYNEDGTLTEFAEAFIRITEPKEVRPFNEIPDPEYDNLYFEYEDLFKKWEAADAEGKEVITTRNPAFQEAIWKRNAYMLFIGSEELVPDFVDYKKKMRQGKPPGQKYWFEDDWYLMDHPELYKYMTNLYKETDGKEGWNPESRDFSKVPPRDVFDMWVVYDNIIGTSEISQSAARKEYRRTHPRLDAWLYLIGAVTKTMAQYAEEEGMTRAEILARELAATRAEIEKLKSDIDEKLRAMSSP